MEPKQKGVRKIIRTHLPEDDQCTAEDLYDGREHPPRWEGNVKRGQVLQSCADDLALKHSKISRPYTEAVGTVHSSTLELARYFEDGGKVEKFVLVRRKTIQKLKELQKQLEMTHKVSELVEIGSTISAIVGGIAWISGTVMTNYNVSGGKELAECGSKVGLAGAIVAPMASIAEKGISSILIRDVHRAILEDRRLCAELEHATELASKIDIHLKSLLGPGLCAFIPDILGILMEVSNMEKSPKEKKNIAKKNILNIQIDLKKTTFCVKGLDYFLDYVFLACLPSASKMLLLTLGKIAKSKSTKHGLNVSTNTVSCFPFSSVTMRIISLAQNTFSLWTKAEELKNDTSQYYETLGMIIRELEDELERNEHK